MIKLVLFSAAICLAGCISGADESSDSPSAPNAQPNVLFISIDDLNDWVGVLGGHPDAKTPNIDRLAARGVTFANAHTQAPICGPSRASLMSGLRPSTTGIYGQVEDTLLRKAHPSLENALFLPEYFGFHGYKTMGIGKLFHRHAPAGVFEESGGRVPGFGPKPEERRYWDREHTSTDWGPFPDTNEEMPDYQSADWTIDRLNREHDRPFFLAVGFLRPHVPWYAPQEWFDMHPLDSVDVPPYRQHDMDDVPAIGHEVADVFQMPTTEWAIKEGHWPAIVQGYLASVSFVDAQVGRVLDALEASSHSENTVIVLFSDHGYHIGEKNRFAKHSLWERATRVPLVFAGTGVSQGNVVHAPVELLDMYPTLLELTGLPPNNANEGTSLKLLIENQSAYWKNVAITTYGQNNHAVVADGFRYIRYEDGSEELYDHSSDPNEWANLASDPNQRDQMDVLAGLLPSTNAKWSEHSDVDIYDYFREQKAASRGTE